MKKHIANSLVLTAFCFVLSATAEDKLVIHPTRGHLTRAFAKMQRSTAEKPETLRVLFYGQSIVGQKVWCDQIVDGWKKKYPTVNFIVKNNAIGGYATDTLVHCIESDVFPFYPDVVFFHDYGDVLGGYGYMLWQVRLRTTAEIVIWSSHYRYDEDPPSVMLVRAGEKVTGRHAYRANDCRRRTTEMMVLADDLDLVFVDLQGHWTKILYDNKWKTTALIEDSVHLNKKGFGFYSSVLLDQLTPGAAGDSGEGASSGTITSVPFEKIAKLGKNGDITIAFVGNRLAVVSNGKGAVEPGLGAFAPCGEVLVDGVPVRDLPSQWYFTRSTPICNWFPGCDTPLKGKTPLLDEKWTLTITSFVTNAPRKYVTYRVEGSETGPDGEGCSTNTFVSKSGRLVIPGPWLGSTCSPWHTRGPVAEISQSVFNACLLSTPVYGPRPAGTETVLAQDLPNGKHILTIRNPHGDLGIETVIVNKPNPKWDRPLTERMQKFVERSAGKQFVYGDSEWH